MIMLADVSFFFRMIRAKHDAELRRLTTQRLESGINSRHYTFVPNSSTVWLSSPNGNIADVIFVTGFRQGNTGIGEMRRGLSRMFVEM